MKHLLTMVLAGVTAACGGSSSMSLSARAGAPSANARGAPGALTLSNGIVLKRVRVVVTKVELELAKTATAGKGDWEEHELEVGPFLIDLVGDSLENGKPSQLVSAAVPEGTYAEIKFVIHRPEAQENRVSTHPELQEMASAHASIIAEGTIDNVNFTFTTPIDVQQELEGSFKLTGGSNLTLNIAVSSWFGGSGSARLDPRDLANQAKIEDNIKRSFKAFRDNDHAGHES